MNHPETGGTFIRNPNTGELKLVVSPTQEPIPEAPMPEAGEQTDPPAAETPKTKVVK